MLLLFPSVPGSADKVNHSVALFHIQFNMRCGGDIEQESSINVVEEESLGLSGDGVGPPYLPPTKEQGDKIRTDKDVCLQEEPLREDGLRRPVTCLLMSMGMLYVTNLLQLVRVCAKTRARIRESS